MERVLTIPSEPSAIADVERFLTELALELGLTEDQTGDLIIAGTEAANNAIYHGNELKPELPVRVKALVERERGHTRLVLAVSDQGHDQFSSTGNTTRPSLPASLLAESGRGLLIIRHLMDEVHISSDDTGTHVTLIKLFESNTAA